MRRTTCGSDGFSKHALWHSLYCNTVTCICDCVLCFSAFSPRCLLWRSIRQFNGLSAAAALTGVRHGDPPVSSDTARVCVLLVAACSFCKLLCSRSCPAFLSVRLVVWELIFCPLTPPEYQTPNRNTTHHQRARPETGKSRVEPATFNGQSVHLCTDNTLQSV